MLVMQEALDDFEGRLNVRLALLAARLDNVSEQLEGVLILMQNHGTSLGEIQALLPKLIEVRRAPRTSETPQPRLTALEGR